MKFNFCPRYGFSAASSRLRCYFLADGLRKLGHEVSIFSSSDRDRIMPKKGDCYFFQKTDNITRWPAIYDFDDAWPSELLNRAWLSSLSLTTDTPEHALLAPSYGICHLLSDPIDYGLSAPLPPAPPAGRLAWFGNHPCFETSRQIFEALSMPRFTISDRQVSKQAFTGIWNYEQFPDTLRECGTAFLSHAGGDLGKSENKAVAAIALGVPVIVGAGSPAYERLMRACGLPEYIVHSPEEALRMWALLEHPAERAEYLAKAQPYVWEHYNAEAVAKRFMEIVEAVL